MKIILHPACVLSLIIFFTGCPRGTEYSLCRTGEEPVDKSLIGTWITADTAAEFKKVVIRKRDAESIMVEVFETSPKYALDATKFIAWTTRIDSLSFIEAQPVGSSDTAFYLYAYKAVEKNILKTYDLILPHGMHHVTSTDTYREEVQEVMTTNEFLIGERIWRKQ